MGYTHYNANTPKAFNRKKFAELAKDCEKIAAHAEEKLGIITRNGLGTGEREINEDIIMLNGDEATDGDYETFCIERVNHSDWFCKTQQRPYDVVVAAILIAFKVKFPKCEVSSDGDANDWKDAFKLYKAVFGNTSDYSIQNSNGSNKLLPK